MPAHFILQVEDSEEDVFFLEFAFKQADITIQRQVARDGQEAIDYLSGTGQFADRSKFPLPTLVLLDLKMPRKTGWDVLEWIRQQPGLRRLPVIILSGSSQPSDINRAYDLGATSYVVKSSINELTEMVTALKHYWFEHNCFPERQVNKEKHRS